MGWDAADFIVFGAMLAGVGVVYALAVRHTGSTAYRAGVGVALAAAFILVWVNGAVGVIGDESNQANLMFVGVLAVGFFGAVVARFEAHGMARALHATAFAQVLVALIALLADSGSSGPTWPLDVLMLTVFFAALWMLSAWLFRNAAREHIPAKTKPKR